MNYELKKKTLTHLEMVRVVSDAVDICFITDENGNDVDFTPEYKIVSLKAAFAEKYLNLELPSGDDEFEEAYDIYMDIDVSDYYDKINLAQWYSIIDSVNGKVEYRKQLMLNKNNTISKLTEELLQQQLEVQTLQKEILEQQKRMNEVVSPEEQKAFADKFSTLDNEKVISEIVKLVHKENKTKPQDHKKAKSPVNFTPKGE